MRDCHLLKALTEVAPAEAADPKGGKGGKPADKGKDAKGKGAPAAPYAHAPRAEDLDRRHALCCRAGT